MSDLETRIRAEDAKHLLANPIFIEAFSGVEKYLDDRLLMCDAADKEAAQRVVISKQLLASLRREIERVVQDGDVATIRMAQLERKTLLSRFQR